jgi:hypothetical protein
MNNTGFGLCSLVLKPGEDGEKIAIRQFLNVTVYTNHETVDVAPLACFVARLDELFAAAWNL